MSTVSSSLKWGRIVLGVIVGILIAVVGLLALQLVWGVVLGFQMRGNPPREALIAAFTSPAFQIANALLVLLGGMLGGRIAARPAGAKRALAGLITGVVLAVLVVAWRLVSWGSLDAWALVYAVLAVLGGWLGARLAPAGNEEEYEQLPSL